MYTRKRLFTFLRYLYLQSLTARYFNTLPVDPAGNVGAEKCHYTTNVVGQTHPTKGRYAGNVFVDLLIVAYGTPAKIGLDSAGSHYVG